MRKMDEGKVEKSGFFIILLVLVECKSKLHIFQVVMVMIGGGGGSCGGGSGGCDGWWLVV